MHKPPWFIRDFGDGNSLSVVASDPELTVVCDLPGAFAGEDGDDAVPEVWENAAIIAAAPDLLTACETYLSGYEGDSLYGKDEPGIAEMREAVAKARGNAQGVA